MRSRIDRAFARYRTTGDPMALARVFDATARELFRLAWHLVGDRHAAEDLVQGTFLAAIEDARAFAPDREVLPWLCGILANRARDLRRRRRVQATHLPAPRLDVVDPVAEASARELGDAVARAVRALPEPYRQVLLLHLEHGLGGVEIGETLARPEATVRSQIHRGLDLLRKALPVGVAGAAHALAPAADLAAVRAAVLGKAGASAALLTKLGVAATMKKAMLAAAALVLALACAWPLWSPGAPPAANATQGVAAQATAPRDERADGANRPDRVAAAPAGATAATALDVDVVWEPDREPAAGVLVRWTPSIDRGELVHRSVRTDAAGRAHFAAVLPGRCVVRTDRLQEVQVELAAGTTGRATIAIPAGIALRGRVVDERDRPVADAEVMFASRNWLDDWSAVARTDDAGAFALRSLPADGLLSARADGFRPAPTQRIVAEGLPAERVLRLASAPGVVDGMVQDARGAPIEGATVLVGETWSAPWWNGDSDRPPLYVVTDADGRVRATGLFPVETRVRAAAPGFAAWSGSVDVAAAMATHVTITLTAGATISGRVTRQHGKAARGTRLTAYPDPVLRVLDARQRSPNWALPTAWADADGNYRLDHVAAGTARVRAERDEARTSADFALADGQQVTWDARLGAGTRLAGTVVDADGAPLAGWKVMLFGQLEVEQRTDALGNFALDVEDDSYVLCLVASNPDVTVLRLPAVRPTPEPLRLEVPRGRMPNGRLLGEIRRPDGLPAADLMFDIQHLDPDGSTTNFGKVDVDAGRFRTGPLFPGRYLVRAHHRQLGLLRCGEWKVPANGCTDIGTHRFAEPASLEIRVVSAAEEPKARTGYLLVRADDEPFGYSYAVEDGLCRIAAIQPGTYFVSALETTRCTVHIEVAAGRACSALLRIPGGVQCVLRWPPIEGDGFLLHAIWRDAMGGIAVDDHAWHPHREHAWDQTTSIPAGRYAVEVLDAFGHSATTTADVHAADPPVVIALPLPVAK